MHAQIISLFVFLLLLFCYPKLLILLLFLGFKSFSLFFMCLFFCERTMQGLIEKYLKSTRGAEVAEEAKDKQTLVILKDN